MINDIRIVLLAFARHLVCWKIDVREWHCNAIGWPVLSVDKLGRHPAPTLDQCA